jgi:hypothetical protein
VKDGTVYEIGKKVSDKDFAAINIKVVKALPVWNYIISPAK